MDWLGPFANLAAILTAAVAVFGYGAYLLDRYRKRRRLERYLRSERQNAEAREKDETGGEGTRKKDTGQRSLLHLMARLGMTEAELLQASFRSSHIKRRVARDDQTGRAAALLLQWQETTAPDARAARQRHTEG